MPDYREFEDGQQIQGTRYRVVRRIGAGGMGTVYEVEHIALGKRFVLKALLRELSRREDLVQRLRNESRALGRLEHPNIVTVTDAGSTASGVPFFVMERLDGETLAERMRRVRRFGISEALSITAAILDGVSAAHEIGIVHRDIKPPNIILVNGDRPKILDFGVAKIADEPGVVTARGVAVGTPRYMSPEQARGESVDGRADIYSSGLLLFEMVSGVGPFDDARDANELILAHIARVAPLLSSVASGVTPELDAVVASMLQKNHHRRPATAREARDKLRAVLATLNQPASALPRPIPAVRPRATVSMGANVGGYAARANRAGEFVPTLGTKTSFSAPAFSLAPSELQPTAVSYLGSRTTEPAPACGDAPPASGTSSRVGAVIMSLAKTELDPMSSPASSHSGLPPLEPAVVPTEIATAMPAPAATDTHTQFPRPEKPRSVTPPPIEPSFPPARGARRTVSTLVAILIGTGVVAGGVFGIDAVRRRARAPVLPVAATEAEDTSREVARQNLSARAEPETARPVTPVAGDETETEEAPRRPRRTSDPSRAPSQSGASARRAAQKRADAAAEPSKEGRTKTASTVTVASPPEQPRAPSPPRSPGVVRPAEGALPGSGL